MAMNFTFQSAIWALLSIAFTLADPPQLTFDNYDDVTKEKTILIRFVTNYCDECEETQEAWDVLSKEWEGHSTGLVVQVFCDSEQGEPICEEFEVQGYPSLYYGDPESPELYKGGLDYESLDAFAKDSISSLPCSVKRLESCSSKVRKLVKNLQDKTQEELEELEKKVLKQVEEEQTRFDKAALKLQQQYQQLANNFNTKIDKLRDDSGFKWIQQLLNEIEKANAEKEVDEDEGTTIDEL